MVGIVMVAAVEVTAAAVVILLRGRTGIGGIDSIGTGCRQLGVDRSWEYRVNATQEHGIRRGWESVRTGSTDQSVP